MASPTAASEPVRVLIVDADPVQRRLIATHLDGRTSNRFSAILMGSAAEALAAGMAPGTLVIADLESTGGPDGIGRLARDVGPVIAVSARGSVHSAVQAMRAGAADFVPKPVGAQALIERLESAMASWGRPVPAARQAAQPGQHRAKAEDARPDGFEGFIGRSPTMQHVYDQIRRVSPSKAPVFITGESGTGKEVCAEAIHRRSGSGERPFVAINCSAIPRDLIESEIFGHVKGAFTGATESRSGAAEMAHGGTLFLDEIGEMDLGLQAKLLRFVQTGIVRRVGDTQSRTVDVRIVCATNRDPLAEVRAGRFREDLYYRLNVLPITLPPLRERPDDILVLAQAFLARFGAEEGRGFAGFAPAAERRLLAHSWPGNVRQLQNLIRRIVVLSEGTLVTEEMLPADFAATEPAATAAAPRLTIVPAAIEPLWQQEQRIIEAVLTAFEGNISRAAAALDISPSTIYRKRQAWSERRLA